MCTLDFSKHVESQCDCPICEYIESVETLGHVVSHRLNTKFCPSEDKLNRNVQCTEENAKQSEFHSSEAIES